jgi:hypothetical protein
MLSLLGKDRRQIRMLPQHGCADRVRLVLLPMRALNGGDVGASLLHRLLETEASLLRIERRRNALEDGDLVAAVETLGERRPYHSSPGTVIRPDERHVDARVAQRRLVELVVDVDDNDVLPHGFGQDRHERTRIGRRNHDRVAALRHHLLDQRDLL